LVTSPTPSTNITFIALSVSLARDKVVHTCCVRQRRFRHHRIPIPKSLDLPQCVGPIRFDAIGVLYAR
ncbi:MAG: hypothetical protein AB7S46_14260, partial [Flavobacteriaceae bacterium]